MSLWQYPTNVVTFFLKIPLRLLGTVPVEKFFFLKIPVMYFVTVIVEELVHAKTQINVS